MRFFPTGAESAAIDKCTIEEIGIPQLVLMERAALTLAEETVKLADKKSKILAICEGGNNGGDGIAAARILHEWGYQADVFYIGGIKRTTEAFDKQKEIALKCGVRFINVSGINISVVDGTDNKPFGKANDASDNWDGDVNGLSELFDRYNVIVDSIFGVGLSRDVVGIQAEIVDTINMLKTKHPEKMIIAADIPSGISAETGKVLGTAVRADVTVTFGFTKLGMLFGDGRTYSGRIITRDIGFPASIYRLNADSYGRSYSEMTGDIQTSSERHNVEQIDDVVSSDGTGRKVTINCYGLDINDIKRMLPVRRADANKGNFGKLLLVAGNSEISGAAVIAGQAAFRTGAGLVKIFTDKKNRDIIGTAVPEALLRTYEHSMLLGEGADEDLETTIKKDVSWSTAVAIGPGLGNDEGAVRLLEAVLSAAEEYDKPVVMDADAINIISERRDILKKFKAQHNSADNEADKKWIITPHMLEMARLVREDGEDVKASLGRVINNRFDVAKSAANEYNVISILKDSRTVISDGGDSFFVNTNGNSGMAKGGSGDSLTGIIGSLLAQGMKPIDAARAGVFIHGAAGDIAAERYGITGMTVTELNDSINDVINKQ